MQKGLNYLLEKYSVASKAILSADGKNVNIDGELFPVFSYESERRFIELRNLFILGRLGNICTYRIGHTAKAGTNLMDLLKKEVGILEFTIDSKTTEIFAIAGKNTMNCIVETENGCICTIELAATLQDRERNIDKHEIITDNGVACDRVVDTQVPQESIYVFGKNKQTFLDTDAELYGYSECEITTVRAAFLLAKNDESRNLAKAKDAHLNKVIEAAKASLATLENVKVEA
ncbi:MAG: hypothetical protein J6Q68_02170 [Clostridia bacterium]|nr:hypothetical protein [Clostridia bacterium]